jgi:cardiolipin synthase
MHTSQIPNLLTYARIGMIPLLIAVIYSEGLGYIAAGIFALASITDWLDGYLARRWQVESAIGKFLDPVADKLLVLAALIVLVEIEIITALPAILILARELLIAGLRECLAGKTIVHVSGLAKWKTVSQMVALTLLLSAEAMLVLPGQLLLWIAVALTWATGVGYLRAALPALKG